MVDDEVRRLKKICDAVLANPDYRPHTMARDGNTWTFCNRATHEVAWKFARYWGFEMLLANAMIDKMENDPQWTKVKEGIWAAEYARSGGFAVACQRGEKHGHIAVVRPEPNKYSHSWHKPVPILNNVGRKNGIMRASEAFKTEPDYWIFKKKTEDK